MKIEVIDGQVVESLQAIIGQHCGGKGVQLGEEMLGVAAVVGLEQLGEEECPLGFYRSEDSGFFGVV